MGTEEPITLQDLLARRLRALRLAHNARQEDVARGALSLGLDWTRSTVAAIEAGRRVLSIEELLLLPAIVGIGYGAACRLDELLGVTPQGFEEWRDEPIALTPSLVVNLREIWPAIMSDAGRADLVNRLPTLGVDALVTVSEPASASANALAPTVQRAAFGLAERHAADRLGVSPLAVSVAAHRLWKRSFSDERDRRVSEQGDAGPRTLRARRGHVTRSMLTEIQSTYPDLEVLSRRVAELAKAERETAVQGATRRSRIEELEARDTQRERDLEEMKDRLEALKARFPKQPAAEKASGRRSRRSPG